MMLNIPICFSLILACASALTTFGRAKSETFKDVTISGYSLFTWKFNVTIASSNSLKEYAESSKIAFDRIDIIGKVPVLRPNSIADMDSLDELIMQFNGLKEIQPGAFQNLPELRKLVITDNDLEEIEEGVFNNQGISTLDLSRNKIAAIAPGAFDDMPELLNINLADNRIKQWNKNWFARTPLLSRVSFQNNLIDTIPANAFKNLKGEKKFGSIPLTINIILSHNKINKIDPKAFRDLNKINNLWLDNNQIDTWTEDLLKNIEVKNLRLDHNQISCLEGDLGKLFVADTTHIDGNPWDCGCLKNVDVWVQENKRHVLVFFSKLECDAQRIRKKIDSLNTLLKELKKNEEEATPEPMD